MTTRNNGNGTLLTDKDYQLWTLLFTTRRAIYAVRRKELHRQKIADSRVAILHAVQEIGNEATVAEISRRIYRESQTVSEIISKMASEGLVLKTKDLGRKNLVRVVITPKGLELYKRSGRRKSIHKLMSCLSDQEKEQLAACLQKLRKKAVTDPD